MIEPIRPDQIAEGKANYLPEAVVDTFNRLIAKNYSSGSSVVKQDEATKALMEVLGMERYEIFEKNYLDVEEIYRAAGWSVVYDKPGYNESYGASFTFRKGE